MKDPTSAARTVRTHQSERLPIYKKYAEELIDKGAAYYCYCTPEELAQMRKEQEARGEATRYDRRCRWQTDEERVEKEAKGLPKVVRLAVPLEGSTTLPDFIHGEITIPNSDVDDQVLMKSDGFPTYHMAVVVDDHLMEITHVIRGDEWISSFPKHILLYNAFGWTPPQFGHMPVVLGPDKKKLSKRHGATSIIQFRDEGYLVEALVNFMALLGWSYDDKTELFSRDDLIKIFTLDHIHRSPAVFDRNKLDWMNGHYIRALSTDELGVRLLPFLNRAGLPVDLKTAQQIAPLVQERLKRLGEAVPLVDFIFADQIEYDPKQLIGNKMDAAGSLHALQNAGQVLDSFDSFDDEEAFEREMRAAAEKLGLKPAQFFGVLRVAVTGKTVTPPLAGTLKLMGKAKTMARLRTALERLQSMT